MPRKNEKALQIKVITDMARFCNPNKGLAIMSIQNAAKIVSGEITSSGELEGRRSPGSLTTISRRQCERYYKTWIDFKVLPCDVLQPFSQGLFLKSIKRLLCIY
jgi:hypothetical protein